MTGQGQVTAAQPGPSLLGKVGARAGPQWVVGHTTGGAFRISLAQTLGICEAEGTQTATAQQTQSRNLETNG